MDAIERDSLLKSLKRLIEKETIGSAKDIAEKLNVSRRTFFRLISHLEISEEIEIEYSKKRKCFYFNENAK